MIVGHLHCDHIANIPTLFAKGNTKARIIVPDGSRSIMKEMLLDSAYINERDCEALNLKCEGRTFTPLYTKDDVEVAMSHVEEYKCGEIIKIDDTLSIKYIPSGHILCACQTEVYIFNGNTTKKILFTSDLGNKVIENRRVFVEPFEAATSCNLLVGECTYGRRSGTITPKIVEKDREKMESVITQYCIDGGHRVLIPTFSLDRMPFILWELYQIFGGCEDFNIPIYVDSPLANRLLDCYSNILRGDQKKKFDELMSWSNIIRIISPEDSKAVMGSNSPKIICASSGMLTAGRSIKWTQSILPNENDCILFVGYAGGNTLAGRIKNGGAHKTISINGKSVKNRCQIVDLRSYSSHMQREDLIDYYCKINTEKILLVHGDIEAKLALKEDLEDELSRRLKTTRVVAVNKGTKLSL